MVSILVFSFKNSIVLTDKSVRNVVFNVIEKFGRIDILVNNAGIAYGMPIADMPLSALHQIMDTNVYDNYLSRFLSERNRMRKHPTQNQLTMSEEASHLYEVTFGFYVYNTQPCAGAMRLVQAVFPHMASRRKGKIVNVGSVVVLAPGPWTGAYVASKAALHALTDTLRLELRPFGINVINVVPGAIMSNIVNCVVANYQLPELKLYKPFEAAILKSSSVTVPGHNGTSPKDLAGKTVAAVLKKNPPAWFTYGRLSTLSAHMYYLTLCIKDYILKKET